MGVAGVNAQEVLSPSLRPPHGLLLPGPVWGLDPSTLRLAAGVVAPWDPLGEGNRTFWRTCSYSTAGGMERKLASALRELLPFFTDLRNAYGQPIAIYLEEPFGGSDKPGKGGKIIKPHPHSFYFVAVVLCALGHIFADVPVTMIGPPSWKAKALGEGHGFAKKPEILAWAQSIGYTGLIEDEADALGIATAGAVIEAAAGKDRAML
jgi:hypothetical protein